MEKLCRICLAQEANIPIFETNDTGENVNSKLSLCVREKVEDIEGYPRNICKSCYNTLDIICLFIKKYKESYKILESGLFPVKCEYHSDNCNGDSNIEIVLTNVKTEKDLILDSTDATPASGLCKLEQLKDLSIKNVCSKTTVIKTETSHVAKCKIEGGLKCNRESPKVNVKVLKHRKGFITIKTNSVKLLNKQKGPQKRKHRQKVTLTEPDLKTDNEPIPPKLCDTCGNVFSTMDQLSYHKKKKHIDKPAKCTTCDRTCSSEYYLNRHIKRKHSDEKEFGCSICTKSFAFKGELASHVKSVHVKKVGPAKTFSCKICGKTYKCRKSVVVHERAVHTGERPAVCTICNTSFTHEDYLREHMRLHTGETPFKCPICGRGYAQRCNMKSHLRIHRVSELDAEALSTLRPNYLRRLKANLCAGDGRQ